MAIILRSEKGSALTHAELDGNFTDLNQRTSPAWAMDGLEPTLRDGVGNPAELANLIGNTIAYSFVENAVSEVYVNWDVPFEYYIGTEIFAAIHWSPGDSTLAGNVRWGLEFTTAAVNGVFNSPTNTFYVTGSSDGTAYRHIQSISAPYVGASPNQRFLIRLFRDGAHETDTLAAPAFLVGIDFYYQVNRFGVPSFLPPYS